MACSLMSACSLVAAPIQGSAWISLCMDASTSCTIFSAACFASGLKYFAT